MSRGIIFDVDPDFGIVQYIKPDEEGFTIETVQNVDLALDMNQRCRSVHTEVPRGDQTWGNHVASIPIVVWERLCKENPELRLWTKDAQVWLLNRLRSNEYEKLRTYDGKA